MIYWACDWVKRIRYKCLIRCPNKQLMMKSIILAVFYVSAEFTFWQTVDSACVCCVQNKQKRRQCSVKNTAQVCLNSKITTVEPR